MDELIDILDETGNFTGKTELKSHAHRMGLFHATTHIWFYTLDGKLLLQQRGKKKDIHPMLWDVSVAGHIGAGESIELAAIREIEEEIGILISKNDLQKIGVFKSMQKHQNGLKDYEFHHTFLCELKLPLESLQRQKSEVESLKLISIDEFYDAVLKGKNAEQFVPHSQEYYETVFREISGCLS